MSCVKIVYIIYPVSINGNVLTKQSLILFCILRKGEQMTKITYLQILIENLEDSSVRFLYYSETF